MTGALLACFWMSIVFIGALAGFLMCFTITKGL